VFLGDVGLGWAGPDPGSCPERASGSAAAVLDFTVGQILREGTGLGGLPAVLERMVSAFGTAFGVRAAVAFQPSAPIGRARRTGR
jgi:hypothetical protein